MAPHEIRRPFKRPLISDQQKRRELSLQRQEQSRRDAQLKSRCLASTILSLQPEPDIELQTRPDPEQQQQQQQEEDYREKGVLDIIDLRQAANLRGPQARKWFANQLMLPEWMIDVPPNLSTHWYVFARPAGKRCFVVSSNGTTVSRLRNGCQLHRFPSALPNGARTARSGQCYCILDCIFHESDETYYVIDMLCWAGMSFYECTAEFRFFWLNSKLAESGALEAPSHYHKYRFSAVPVYNCDEGGLQAAYTGTVPYVKDGLIFYNKHAHYQTGNTPLTLVWKDENCSQYVIDTDGKGEIPNQQQVALELLEDGRLATSDDPAIIFGCLNSDFIEQNGLQCGSLLRFAISEGGLCFMDGKLEKADLRYVGKVNRARAFADSYSKVMFQYTARHSPLSIEHLFAYVKSSTEYENKNCEMEMVG